MQLPAKLLGRVRVGVGVGAVLLGGCDVVAEVQGSTVEPAVAEANASIRSEAEARAAETEEATQPLLLSRPVAKIVEETVRRSETGSSSEPAEPESGVFAPAIGDLGRAVAPEGERGFVPYADGSGSIALATPAPPPTKVRPRPPKRPVTEPAPLAIEPGPRPFPGVDEPCDPEIETGIKLGIGTVTTPKSGWSCPACGRG